jgi:predicted AlkP superfamily phosphohydrolase/phosphomutase
LSSPRLLLIGLDAVDSALARRWADEGHLPTLARVLASGAVAPIVTPLAVLEGGVWPTFLTSSSPATHGMFAYRQLKRGTYDLEFGLYADRLPVPPFWDSLSRAGKRVAIIDAPFARPVRRLNGIQVTNWGAHDAWSCERSSWPRSLIGDLVRRFGDHPVAQCNVGRKRSLKEYESLRDQLIEGVRQKTALLRYCLKLDDWDFFLGVFSESHCVGHHFWHFLDPGHPRHDPSAASSLATAIRDVYREIDRGVGSLLDDVGRESDVLLMLSHGMGPFYAGAHLLQSVLDGLGMSGEVPREKDSSKDSSIVGPFVWNLRYLLPTQVRQRVKGWRPELASALWHRTHAAAASPWRLARAFAVPENNMTSGIRINLQGREPAGTVQPGPEYESLCRELMEVLRALEDPETGRKVVQWVARSADLYQGPHLTDFPDLLIEWEHSAPIKAVRSPQIGTVARDFPWERTGDHRANGLLIGHGPTFHLGQIEEEVRTEDVAPTVLEFFGVPSPRGYEGRSVRALLSGTPDLAGAVTTRPEGAPPP